MDITTRRNILRKIGFDIFVKIDDILPGFFERDYIVTKLAEKARQDPDIVLLEPEVVASTNVFLPQGSRVRIDNLLNIYLPRGYNILISPEKSDEKEVLRVGELRNGGNKLINCLAYDFVCDSMSFELGREHMNVKKHNWVCVALYHNGVNGNV